MLEPEYISGFVAADGSFFISKPSEKTKWPNYDATFSVAQDKRDVDLLRRILLTLDCGNIKTDSSGMHYLSVRNKEDLQLKIIPFLPNTLLIVKNIVILSIFHLRFLSYMKTRVKVLKILLKNNVSIWIFVYLKWIKIDTHRPKIFLFIHSDSAGVRSFDFFLYQGLIGLTLIKMLIQMKVFCTRIIPLFRFFILKKVESSSTFIPSPKPIRVTSELKTLNPRRSYYTRSPHTGPNKDVKILHPWWVTGYIDGEGSFMVNTSKSKTTTTGYTAKLVFQVTVHPCDVAILHYLKAFFMV